ncbi:DNA repair protein RecO [Corynebacterium endometrii]|uniref:DNA repair protein RecO n=1 Tax=Corynebacterium endometrii TaxID=2488819 RepID=A0A4P7QH57_9CORY|nr:DNA repair protein RecO [Corynebacterium endometrii]
MVIRSYDFGEADRIIVLLTKEHGLVRGVAKGVRRAKSRFGSRLQPFVELDVQLYPGRNLSTISQADTVTYHGARIIEEYERYTAACAALESAERLAFADDSPAHGDAFLYTRISETLERLNAPRDSNALPDALLGEAGPTALLDAFLLQAMAHAGWAPSLFDCAACGAGGPHHAFHPAVGGAACHQCRPSGSAEVDPEALHLMWLLAGDHLASAGTILQGRPDLGATAHQLTKAHLQWHLERKVTALSVMDQS